MRSNEHLMDDVLPRPLSREGAGMTPGLRRAGADAAALALLLVVGAAISGQSVERRPDLAQGDGFLFDEPGLNLVAADTLLRGGRLYRDYTLPYGLVPTATHAAMAQALGNTVSTYILYVQVTSLAHLALAYLLLRQSVRTGTALLVGLVGLIPVALTPGGPTVWMEFAYTTFERCVFAAVFLAWAPAPRRGLGRSCLLGALIGFCQWVKFGGAAFVYAPILALDLAGLVGVRRDRAARRQALVALAAIPLAAAAVEAARVAFMFATLPGPVARDVIWPAYTAAHYASIIRDHPNLVYPSWVGWRYFILRQLNIVLGLVLGVAGLAILVRRLGPLVARGDDPGALGEALEEFRLMLPLLFYAAGTFKYIGHVYIFIKYYWCLIVSAGHAIDRMPAWGRGLVLLAWLPPWYLMGKVIFVDRPPADVVRFELPDREAIAIHRSERDRLLAILEELRPGPGADGRTAVLCVPQNSGFLLFYGLPRATRYASFLTHYIRDYDTPDLLIQIGRTRAIVMYHLIDETPLAEPYPILARVLDPLLVDAIRASVVRITRIDDRCVVMHLSGPPVLAGRRASVEPRRGDISAPSPTSASGRPTSPAGE